MGQLVCGGGMCKCSFGVAPAPIMALPLNRPLSPVMPAANIMDNKPFVNIIPFGMCSSLANPTVAAATSAALGVLTPMPCIPNTVAPWVPGSPTVMVGGMPALSNSSKLMCMWGGVINIVSPGQFMAQVP